MIRSGIGIWLLVMACGVKKLDRRLVEPVHAATLDRKSPYLKAHLRSGAVYVLDNWRADSAGAEITGRGVLLSPTRSVLDSGTFALPADSVALFETNVVSGSGGNAAITVVAGITVAVAGYCAANPKSCFGSCPTFYVPDGEGSYLHAEAFSASIAPGLEATDVDALVRAHPTGRDFPVRLTNEAFETHVIRYADLLVAARPGGGDVGYSIDGRFIGMNPLPPAARCLAAEGDCRGTLEAFDRRERSSPADSTDLAARETIMLTFDSVPDGPAGVVITSRQSLMSTYLLYQTLAWLGESATPLLARLNGSGPADGAGGLSHLLGRIEVQLPGADGWATIGSVGETGPIAPDTRLVPLPPVTGPLTIRLQLTRGMWRLDQVRLVSLTGPVEPVRLRPARVLREGRPDRVTLAALVSRERPLVTLPGDAYELIYRLPPHPEHYALFLEARGYYLEWMRQEWLAEQNPVLAARTFLDPAGTLRALAPAYKTAEPGLESLFWSSRYVRH